MTTLAEMWQRYLGNEAPSSGSVQTPPPPVGQDDPFRKWGPPPAKMPPMTPAQATRSYYADPTQTTMLGAPTGETPTGMKTGPMQALDSFLRSRAYQGLRSADFNQKIDIVPPRGYQGPGQISFQTNPGLQGLLSLAQLIAAGRGGGGRLF